MSLMNRRTFAKLAAAIGATAVFGDLPAESSHVRWRERREFFAEGVASGDPDSNSVLLWTRYEKPTAGRSCELQVEVAEDQPFTRVIARTTTHVSAASDWTCRALVGGLKPRSVYWYRFADSEGNGSRIGRTITAPSDDDPRPASFAFVSCQNATQGAQNAYRRMIFEDKCAEKENQLGFVLHLGDFIYEIVWYPEDRPQGMYDRRLRDIVRYEHGEKIQDFHIPTTLNDYRAVYRAYLHDPDIQDARARWPFVNMWDNHEFSWLGWQSIQKFGGVNRPAQTRKVAANQAFFEFQPARMARPNTKSMEEFAGPKVEDTPVDKFDEHGLGQDKNNLLAIGSLTGYRAIRWGRNVELIVTDQRTYQSEEPTDTREAKALFLDVFPEMLPEDGLTILDAARTYNNGRPPEEIRSVDGSVHIPNLWKDRPPKTVLGIEQKAWFLDRLKQSKATWKIWGNTTATLQMRADPQNLPSESTATWPWSGYAAIPLGDWSTAYTELGEIYDFVRNQGVAGFVTVAGDRHSFWAGLASKSLSADSFFPVGVVFVTGSISAPGLVEAYEHGIPKDHPLRALYVGQGPKDQQPQPTVNLLLHHGVKACLEYTKTGDVEKARALTNPELAPHVNFVDMGGHGYSVVRATSDLIQTEFVCIPRPLERSEREDGGAIRYRVRFKSRVWKRNERPRLEAIVVEGDPKFSI